MTKISKIPGRAETVEEKEQLLASILDAWKAVPDLRLGQFLLNAIADQAVLYNIEDADLADELLEWALAKKGHWAVYCASGRAVYYSGNLRNGGPHFCEHPSFVSSYTAATKEEALAGAARCLKDRIENLNRDLKQAQEALQCVENPKSEKEELADQKKLMKRVEKYLKGT